MLPGLFQAVSAGLTDRLAAALVFVVGGDMAQALVGSDRVVLHLDDVELGP